MVGSSQMHHRERVEDVASFEIYYGHLNRELILLAAKRSS
jgi:hypothetical protein